MRTSFNKLIKDESPRQRSREKPPNHPSPNGSDRHRPRPSLRVLPGCPKGNQERAFAGQRCWLNKRFLPSSLNVKTNFQQFQPFFVIPKSPKNKKTNKNHFWRIDFHDEERNILRGAKKEYVKPLIKLLKVKTLTICHFEKLRNQNLPSSFVTPTTP